MPKNAQNKKNKKIKMDIYSSLIMFTTISGGKMGSKHVKTTIFGWAEWKKAPKTLKEF